MTATNLSAMSSGAESIGVILAFNTIGWGPSNVLFQAVDALLGDPLISSAFDGEQPSQTLAHIEDTTVDSAATSASAPRTRATITAEVSNTATSAPGAIMGAGGMAAAFILASNMISSGAEASIEYAATGTVDAADDVEVAASEPRASTRRARCTPTSRRRTTRAPGS